MSAQIYTLIGLTVLVAALVTVLLFSVLRLFSAARDVRERAPAGAREQVWMTAAINDAMTRLRDREHELEARADAAERLIADVVAGLASGLLVVGADGRVRILNASARRILDLRADLDASAPFRDVLSGVPSLAAAIDEGLRTGRAIVRRTLVFGGEQPGPRAVTHLGVTVSPVSGNGREAAGVICLFSDLTSAVAMEEQVRLKESLSRLGELTAGLAHEFRNGLATIHGYARMLDTSALPASESAYVEGIRQETQALGDVVNTFLNFARPTPVAMAAVDIGSLATRVVAECRSEAEEHGGTIRAAGEFGIVDGDEVLLRQALGNLCRNAVEACVEAGRTPDVELRGRVDAEHGRLLLSVSDNGPGIDAAVLPRIFQPFFTTRKQGTGLGLAIVQKIVVTHNGRVTAANRGDGGASFQVVLPLTANPLPSAAG